MDLDGWAGPDGAVAAGAGGSAGGPAGMPGGGAARLGPDVAGESKRDKRRREMATKVERIRQETIERKDSIHADLHESYRIHLNAVLGLPYPSHPEYLLRLHALSVQRDADTLAARLEATYTLEAARQLYHSEVDRVEDEYESAKKAIKDKLLEACDERAKKLKEEKDSMELPTLEGGLYGDAGKHATRRRGVNGFTATASANGATSAAMTASGSTNGISISGIALPPSATGEASTSAGQLSQTGTSSPHAAGMQPNLSSTQISDPFNYSLLPSSSVLANNALHPSMLLLQPGSNALLQSLKMGNHYHHHRTTGGRTKAGYPPNGLIITPGTYAVLGKSITALNQLRAEEITDDLESFRVRKRKRGTETRERGVKRQAMQQAF